MATIGTFIKRGDDLHGAIRTLTLDVDLVMRPIPKTKADSPDFLIYAAGAVLDAVSKTIDKCCEAIEADVGHAISHDIAAEVV